MKSYLFAVKNIEIPIIGKIITEAYSSDENQDSYIFVYNDHDEEKSGIFTSSKFMFDKDNFNPVGHIRNDHVFTVGDIFLLEPNGICTLLIETQSYSNALFLTEKCNSRCILCPQPPQNNSHVLFDQVMQILSLIDQDAKVLGITGGEPTVAWAELVKILKECQKRIPEASIQLLTNARLLESSEKVKQLKNANNNLLVCVPLYSDIDTIHDKIVSAKGAYWETINGLYNLAKEGIPIEIRTVITKMNFSRLPLFAEFIYSNFPFINHVAIMGLEPIGLALENIKDLWIDPIDYQHELEGAVKVLHRRNCNVSVYNHQLCTLTPFLKVFSRKAISEWKIRYYEVCLKCSFQRNCGGLFESASIYHSRALRAL